LIHHPACELSTLIKVKVTLHLIRLINDTAKIVAFNVQKLARKLGRAVIAATTHTDLFDDLNPSVHIHKRFGKEVTVKYYPNEPAKECSLSKRCE